MASTARPLRWALGAVALAGLGAGVFLLTRRPKLLEGHALIPTERLDSGATHPVSPPDQDQPQSPAPSTVARPSDDAPKTPAESIRKRLEVVVGLGDHPQPLKPGETSADVAELQRQLGRAGFQVSVTGTYDDPTYQAVRRFQFDKNLRADGVLDYDTWHALQQVIDPNYKQNPLIKAIRNGEIFN